MAAESLHELSPDLKKETIDKHRAIRSLMEELEAVDWYRQRADATSDEALKAIMLHNAREEIEHACMVLEWLRRNDAEFDKQLRTYLFAKGEITEVEDAVETK
jgi:ferritin-like protein